MCVQGENCVSPLVYVFFCICQEKDVCIALEPLGQSWVWKGMEFSRLFFCLVLFVLFVLLFVCLCVSVCVCVCLCVCVCVSVCVSLGFSRVT
jgi:hypothetical protein